MDGFMDIQYQVNVGEFEFSDDEENEPIEYSLSDIEETLPLNQVKETLIKNGPLGYPEKGCWYVDSKMYAEIKENLCARAERKTRRKAKEKPPPRYIKRNKEKKRRKVPYSNGVLGCISVDLTCNECGKKFKNISKLERHKKLKFDCSRCGSKFCSNQLKNEHEVTCVTEDDVLFCDICGEIMETRDQLNQHSFTHDRIECPNCNLILANRGCLLNHQKNQCPKLKKHKFLCEYCEEAFASFKKLRTHIHSHLLKLFGTCSFCSLVFTSVKELDKHDCIKKVPKGSKKCGICLEVFVSSVQLKLHMLSHQGSSFKCENCSSEFLTPNKLHIHIQKQKCTQHICSNRDCEEVFNDRKSLQEHKRKHKLRDNFECNDCHAKFTSLNKLEIHILNVHHGISFMCDTCKLQFASEKELEQHAGAKCAPPFECYQCQRLFYKRAYFMRHIANHSKTTYKCVFCYSTFSREFSYNRHMEKMNCSKNARKQMLMTYKYTTCSICDIAFETEDLLIEHFQVQHHIKPHKCFYCDERLSTFKSLQQHIHVHNVEKFTCGSCGKPYTSQEGFRKHRLKHTRLKHKCPYCDSEYLHKNRFIYHISSCSKNPDNGYSPANEVSTTGNSSAKKHKQARQLNWESKIILKHVRGDPQTLSNGVPNRRYNRDLFFDESSSDSDEKKGWFEEYYKTSEDKNDSSSVVDDSNHCGDSDIDVDEFLQTGEIVKVNKESTKEGVVVEIPGDDGVDVSDAESIQSSSSSDDSEVMEEPLPTDKNFKKCRLCAMNFGQEYELLHHFIKSHPGKVAHKCPTCDFSCPLYAQLKEHLKDHGIGKSVSNCDNCSKQFKGRRKLEKHKIKCKGVSNTKATTDTCKICSKIFHSKSEFQLHTEICTDAKQTAEENVDQVEEQDNITLAFGTEEDWINDTAAENEVTFVPVEDTAPQNEPEAEESNEGSEGKKEHAFEEPPLDSFPCRLCDKKFQYERGIVQHFKWDHPGEKPLICHVCNLPLADKLKEHLKTHGIGEEFICELCGKRFNQKFVSKIHELWHQGIEFKCEFCRQRFLNQSKMDKHIAEKKCLNRVSLMRLPCDVCGKSYRSKFGLAKHSLTHIPKDLRPVKQKLNCEFCGKWFENNNGLQRHRRTHTGERPFHCRHCPKAFAQEGNCKAHERIHTGETRPRKKIQPLYEPTTFTYSDLMQPIMSPIMREEEAIMV